MNAETRFRRFAFDQVFEATSPRVATMDAAGLRRHVAVLEAELAMLRHDAAGTIAGAREEGFVAGLEQARGEHRAALLSATDALQATVEEVQSQLDTIADDAAREAAEVACAAAEMLAARALTETPAAAIDEAIGRALRRIARGQEIQVAVAPTLVPDLEELVAIRRAGDRRRLAITIVADAHIAPGDAHIEWDRGGVILNAADRATAVREALAPILERQAAATPDDPDVA